ncbi:MAG: hypothetical protein JNM27_18500 [Leptospirales bacterium]|nr:hypothetical protein [Leptospirales bacterium]
MKLRYRHASEFSQKSLDAWVSLISSQIEKLSNRIDEINAWQRREFFVLERMNAGVFRQELIGIYGAVWSFVADIQVVKATRLAKAPRRLFAHREYWSQVLVAGYGRITKQSISQSDAWAIGVVNKARKVRERNDWRTCMWNGFRELWKPNTRKPRLQLNVPTRLSQPVHVCN